MAKKKKIVDRLDRLTLRLDKLEIAHENHSHYGGVVYDNNNKTVYPSLSPSTRCRTHCQENTHCRCKQCHDSGRNSLFPDLSAPAPGEAGPADVAGFVYDSTGRHGDVAADTKYTGNSFCNGD